MSLESVPAVDAVRSRLVAVVGAGIAGLACARTLHDHGVAVTVLDRGRVPGGRLATRQRGPFAFDHGAQYFTARDERLARCVRSWEQDGVVASWTGRLCARGEDGTLEPLAAEPRWVGVPRMNAVARHLAADLDVQARTVVSALDGAAGARRLRLAGGSVAGPFDVVLVAAPAPRAAVLLAATPALAAHAAAAALAPCQAVLVAFAEPIDPGFDGATIAGSPLAWAACESSKPGRPPAACWVLHGSPAWSAAHVDASRDQVGEALLAAFAGVVGRRLPPVLYRETHCWRAALVTRPVGAECLWDGAEGLGACGDWCLGGRVEAAFLSGVALAGRVLGAGR